MNWLTLPRDMSSRISGSLIAQQPRKVRTRLKASSHTAELMMEASSLLNGYAETFQQTKTAPLDNRAGSLVHTEL
ncbi:hypothetical protein EVAR_65345_1 [Eumeta japonica]|uniref:Uncharacterized protein n=1 Tax=Eumeta variegata TaxID=151549 RepID=A0A4C1Z5F3_EUMVA|nr:hypothetical protein EVAR_65345_1 [Eumeta japonica]